MTDKIIEFLSTQGSAAKRPPVTLETNLFDEGVLDSFGLVEFVTFLEAETGVSFTDDDLNDDRFTSVAGILDLLASKGPTVHG